MVIQQKYRMISSSSKFMVSLIHPQRKHEFPHEALANMGDDSAASQAFAASWGGLWTDEQAKAIAATGQELEGIYRTLRDILRRAWRGDKDAIASLEGMTRTQFRWHFNGKHAELTPEDLWTAIVLLFLRDHAAGRTAICANPGCPSPYFVRKRKTQKYCQSGSCTDYGVRLSTNLWWAKHGNAWRAKKRKEANK
jgi:predicted RNA-binding Zn ribbon-like protein